MPNVQISDYVGSVQRSLFGVELDVEKAQEMVAEAKRDRRRVWILGNGGSLAIAQHFAQDLLKLCGVRAHAINCPSILTAFANDDGFEYSLFNPLARLADENDLIFIFSCSGKSRNYIEFVSGFPEQRHRIISVIGTDGGFLLTKSEVSIHIKSNDYQVCETAFCVVADVLVKSLLEA